jgi:hypothetical protein
MPVSFQPVFQINIEDLEDDSVASVEKSDCTLSGDKGRAQHGNPETKRDGDVIKATPPEQVWGGAYVDEEGGQGMSEGRSYSDSHVSCAASFSEIHFSEFNFVNCLRAKKSL